SLMLPPEAFSISFAQAIVAGTSGWAGGTHSDTFRLTVLSCAVAGVIASPAQPAISSARSAFLIVISPSDGGPVLRPPALFNMLSSTARNASMVCIFHALHGKGHCKIPGGYGLFRHVCVRRCPTAER